MPITITVSEKSHSCGEEATFTIRADDAFKELELCLSKDGYKIIRQHALELNDNVATVTGTMNEPGFLRCRVNYVVDGKQWYAIAACPFESENIQPTTTKPDDFDEFWAAQKAELAKVPLDAQLDHVNELCHDQTFDFYDISLASIEESRVYGYIAKPKKPTGKMPAILSLQNHGGGAWDLPTAWVTDFAEMGFLAMAMNTHEAQNRQDKAYYDALNAGPLASYTLRDFFDRDKYYFKKVYMRIIRALDYLSSCDDWDGKTLILTGRSQGGGLSFVGAGLDDRVTAAVFAVPAMCEHGGHKFGRVASWPRMLPYDEHDYGSNFQDSTGNAHGPVSDAVWQVSRYYDAVNFARNITCPIAVALGWIDTCVPPTTVHAALNVITSDTTIIEAPQLGHNADMNPDYDREQRILQFAQSGGSICYILES
ncbi:MAG: acetylxylan esterase [Planctomycetes bacterium]|nr:acetylxylan esterase [Planctomycetota bacterium]